MNRNRLIAGLGILAVVGILVVWGLVSLWVKWNARTPEAHYRIPVSKLLYCDSNQDRPCVVSFGIDANGNMLVNMLLDPSFPDFYLKIIRNKGESLYECQQVKGFPTTNAYCTGEQVQPGERPQLMLVAKNKDTVLAEGSFVIIGLALSTPEEGFITPTEPPAVLESTLEPTLEPTVSPTAFILEILSPIPTRPTVTPKPAYPNPSYP